MRERPPTGTPTHSADRTTARAPVVLTGATAIAAVIAAAVVATGAADAGTAGSMHARPTASSAGLSILPLPRPRDFVDRVSHPYLPLPPGTRWVYAGRGADRGERTVVTVLRRTRVIEGINATVVHDVVSEDGALVEDTHDWYAQDRLGNVWYLGERTREYDGGEVVSREGSWEAGVGQAQAGIAMPASTDPGAPYRQEFDPGDAEDQAEVVHQRGQVRVPFGRVERVVVTDETTPLEPAVDELKFYAPGVGLVMALGVSPRFSRSVLLRVDRR